MKTPGKRVRTEIIDKDILDQIEKKWGPWEQYNMLVEECTELNLAMLKHMRHSKFSVEDKKDADKAQIADEMADVLIMISQIKQFLNIENQVDARIKFKVERLISRLDAHDTSKKT